MTDPEYSKTFFAKFFFLFSICEP